MKGSLIIVGFFVLGIIVGLCDVIPSSFPASDVSYYALCCLMFCVGISIGCDTSILKSFRKVNPRLMMLPVMTILGTFAGCAAASLVLGHRQLSDCLAIGSGFGYYSLSSIFITQYRGAELGTIANNDMYGEEPDSWKSQIEALGITTTGHLNGIGRYPSIQELYIQHALKAIQAGTPA